MTVVDFAMPSLGADMDSGTITEWLIDVGDSVNRGDIVAIVETDKADIDIEVWNSGVVTELVVPVGELVAVGTPLARIEVASSDAVGDDPTHDGVAGERPEPRPVISETPSAVSATIPEPAPAPAAPPTTATVRPTVTASTAYGSPAGGPDRSGPGSLASPLVRRLASERGIDLGEVHGSGPGGAVLARDLSAIRPIAERPDDPPVAGRSTGGSGDRGNQSDRMRRAIADLMSRSNREIPHYYLEEAIDVEAAMTWLESLNAERSVDERVLPAALVMKAVALALAKHREFNGFWTDDGFRQGDGVHLGIAVSLRGGGLVAPGIRNADRLGVEELMAALRDLVDRSRSSRLRASEMTDPTVTVTNLGDRGVEVVHGVIYPPQVALIGVGRISARPTVIDGTVVARRQVTVTLAADHRASDGQRGARMLNTISRLLQEPEEL